MSKTRFLCGFEVYNRNESSMCLEEPGRGGGGWIANRVIKLRLIVFTACPSTYKIK